MAFNMARWRVQSNNLYLPYADLDTAGNVGRQLLIPDDVGLALAYSVLQTPTAFSTMKADMRGKAIGAPVEPAFTTGVLLVQALAGSQVLTYTMPIRADRFNGFSTASAVRCKFTLYETGLPFYAVFGSNTPASISLSSMVVEFTNTTATPTTFNFLALQL